MNTLMTLSDPHDSDFSFLSEADETSSSGCTGKLPGDMVAIINRENGRLECLGVISAVNHGEDAIAVDNIQQEFHLSGKGRDEVTVTYTNSAIVLNMKGEVIRPSMTHEETKVYPPMYDIRPVTVDDLQLLSEREEEDMARFWGDL